MYDRNLSNDPHLSENLALGITPYPHLGSSQLWRKKLLAGAMYLGHMPLHILNNAHTQPRAMVLRWTCVEIIFHLIEVIPRGYFRIPTYLSPKRRRKYFMRTGPLHNPQNLPRSTTQLWQAELWTQCPIMAWQGRPIGRAPLQGLVRLAGHPVGIAGWCSWTFATLHAAYPPRIDELWYFT